MLLLFYKKLNVIFKEQELKKIKTEEQKVAKEKAKAKEKAEKEKEEPKIVVNRPLG